MNGCPKACKASPRCFRTPNETSSRPPPEIRPTEPMSMPPLTSPLSHLRLTRSGGHGQARGAARRQPQLRSRGRH
eukprot:4940852-Pyramimonas_sp.AAC.1